MVQSVKLVKIGLSPYYLNLISQHEDITGERPGSFAGRVVKNILDQKVSDGFFGDPELRDWADFAQTLVSKVAELCDELEDEKVSAGVKKKIREVRDTISD